MESQEQRPEAIKIGDDTVDFVRIGNQNRLLFVSRKMAKRILKKGYDKRHNPVLEYKKFVDFLDENIGQRLVFTEEFFSGSIYKVSPTQIAFEDPEIKIIVPGRLRELDNHCPVCGRFGRIKCRTCPMRTCSWTCDQTAHDLHHNECPM